MEAQKYPKPMIFLHWFTLILLVIEIILGLNLENKEFAPKDFNWFRAHALLGVLIMILTIVRLFIRMKNKGRLPEIEFYSKMHKAMVTGVHHAMYTLLIVIPAIGFYMVYKTGALQYDLGGPFPEGAKLDEGLHEIHESLVWVLVALVALHVGGVILYKIKTGESLLKRMCVRG